MQAIAIILKFRFGKIKTTNQNELLNIINRSVNDRLWLVYYYQADHHQLTVHLS
jgi:hypothetical protein